MLPIRPDKHGEYSHFPPILMFTPEVQAGIQAACDLEFGKQALEPMDQLSTDELIQVMQDFTPNIVNDLMSILDQRPF